MSRGGEISARRLHQTSVKFRDRLVVLASLFPFFDREGIVWKIMVAWRSSDRILLLDFAPGRFGTNWWGFTVNAALAEERPLTLDRVAGVDRFWHFDPWWVLRHHRFNGHPATPVLKTTNLAGRTHRPIVRLAFEADLSRVASYSTARHGALVPFQTDVVPRRERARAPAADRRRSAWELRPSWRAS